MPSITTTDFIEARYGKPFKEVLIDLYSKHRKIKKVAEELGMTRQNLWIQMRILGLDWRNLNLAVLTRERQQAEVQAANGHVDVSYE